MLSEKPSGPSLPISPSLIACRVTAMSIQLGNHDLFPMPRETNRNNSFALSKSLTLNTVASKSHQAIMANNPGISAHGSLANPRHNLPHHEQSPACKTQFFGMRLKGLDE
ncbi:hypothetical protein HOY82DRAFT_541306 [Tuber indicum]|nr:hypothetical protein HOY82DRAFT_541306 [Tuber indicum]